MKIIICALIFMLLMPTALKAAEGVPVPVIMYHLITERPKYIGKYGITPAELETDLKYLQSEGYTTVVMQDLINYVENGVALPEKPIVLTFDDGNNSDYQYLLPLLKKYEMRAVAAIIGKATDECTKNAEEYPTAHYPNLTWPQIKELHQSGVIEIQNHGYNMHGKGGSGEKKGEALEAYHTRLYNDLKKLQELCQTHLGHTPTTFVYPLGIIGKDSRKVLESLGMSASLSCHEGVTVVKIGDKDCLFKMHRYNRPSGKTVREILSKGNLY